MWFLRHTRLPIYFQLKILCNSLICKKYRLCFSGRKRNITRNTWYVALPICLLRVYYYWLRWSVGTKEIWPSISDKRFTVMDVCCLSRLRVAEINWGIFIMNWLVFRSSGFILITHWGRVTHMFVGNLTIAWSAPSHYLNQCWNIVNWTIRNKFQLNCYRNWKIFSQENAFENVVWKMAAIMSRPQCVNFKVTCQNYDYDFETYHTPHYHNHTTICYH